MKRPQFRLEQLLRQADTTVELYALGAALGHVEGTELIRPDIASLSDLAIAIHEQAIRDVRAMYGEEEVSRVKAETPLEVAYQEDKRRVVLQPANPLAVIAYAR